MKNKNNWRLPTKEELNKMYENLHCKGIGGFANDYYWSSSEYSSNNAWYQYFYNGYQDDNDKTVTFRVRSVRTFETDYPENFNIGREQVFDGIIFDIQDNTLFVCKKEDEKILYIWYQAMKLFEDKQEDVIICKETYNNKKLTITIKSDEIGSGKTLASYYLYKLLRDSGAFVKVIEKGEVVSNSHIIESLSKCNKLGDYTGKLFDIVVED